MVLDNLRELLEKALITIDVLEKDQNSLQPQGLSVAEKVNITNKRKKRRKHGIQNSKNF